MARFDDERGRGEMDDRYRRAALAHPVRQRILRLMLDGMEAGAIELAAELDEAPGRIAYHLLVLTRRRALRGIARGPAAPPDFRLAPQALWARKMLAEFDERDRNDDPGGRD
jgi:hypothetical protein